MVRPPPEPIPVAVEQARGDDTRIFDVRVAEGHLRIVLHDAEPRDYADPRGLLAPRRAELSSERPEAAAALLGEVARWVGVEGEAFERPAGEVEVSYEDLSETRAGRATWVSCHLLLAVPDGRQAGLHLQFQDPGGGGMLLESHVGTPRGLVELLGAALG